MRRKQSACKYDASSSGRMRPVIDSCTVGRAMCGRAAMLSLRRPELPSAGGEPMKERLAPHACLPADPAATMIGRAWVPALDAPVLVLVTHDSVVDVSSVAATSSELLELA